jgi:probable phosphoglycerate mutase
MELLLIRHGQSVANKEGRLQGQFDSPLTDHGREQASALARRLQHDRWDISAIYASDLRRAKETAEILAASLDLPLVLDSRLREYGFGVLTGLIWREIEPRFPEIWHAMVHRTQWPPIPGEEGNRAFQARLVAALEEIQTRHEAEETVAVVSHGGSLGMMLAHFLELDPHLPTPFRFGNTSLSAVEFTPRGARLALMNDTCHLDGDLR